MLNKPYVFYTEVYAEGNLVNCVYFINEECWAQPFAKQMQTGPAFEHYKPTEEDHKDWCKNRAMFRACPRLLTYQDHLKAIGLEKE